MTTFLRIVEAARRYARGLREADAAVPPHPYLRDPHSGAGNCQVCHREKEFAAHSRLRP